MYIKWRNVTNNRKQVNCPLCPKNPYICFGFHGVQRPETTCMVSGLCIPFKHLIEVLYGLLERGKHSLKQVPPAFVFELHLTFNIALIYTVGVPTLNLLHVV